MEENNIITVPEEAPEVISEEILETVPEANAEGSENTKPKKKFTIDPDFFTFKPKKQGFNLKTVTAALCVLIALLQIVACFASPGLASIQYRNEQINQFKVNISNYEANIEECEQLIEECTLAKESLMAELPDYEAALEEAQNAAAPMETALQEAELALDAVCTRSSYSSFYCSVECQPLHNAVADAKAALSEAKTAVKNCQRDVDRCLSDITSCDYEVESLNEEIASCQRKIAEQKSSISEIRGKIAGAWISFIFRIAANLVSVCGLALLAKVLLEDAATRKALLISCGALAIGAILSFVVTAIESGIGASSIIAYLFLSPHTYAVLAMAMFAKILQKKTEKPVVCRTVAIVAAVVSVFAGEILYGGILTDSIINLPISFLFGITLILLAFIVEPLVFTEYISIAKHIFLSLITFGIWVAVWTYHVTKNLNKVADAEERTPRNELLLCMFLPFYAPYWTFKTAEYVESYGMEKEKSFNLEIPALVFAFICPLFATVLIQNKINVAVGKPNTAA